MGCEDGHRRRAAIVAVLKYADRYPKSDLAFEELAEVRTAFATRADLLLALRSEWQQVFRAQIELHTLDTEGRPLEASVVCRRASDAAAALRPTLRRVLDRHAAECQNARTSGRSEGRCPDDSRADSRGAAGYPRTRRACRHEAGGPAKALRA